jgi:hypothetical protein
MRFALMIAAVLLTAAVRLPDTTKGVIDGQVAVIIWPRFRDQPIEPAHCASHLVPVTDPDSELLFPCGVWFRPPPATYRVWIEQGDLISPFPNILTYAGGPFKERGLAAMFDMVAGGKVQLSRSIQVAEHNQLRVLHLDSHLRLGTLGRFFERRIPRDKAHQPVLMPTGRIIAAITDRQGDAVALSGPVTITATTAAPVSPRPPIKGSDVLVILTRARTASKETPDDILMTLDMEERSVPPDVFLSTADRVFGIWYAIDAPRAVFRIASATMALPPEEIKLQQGTVRTLRRTLKTLPRLAISVREPAGTLADAKRSIDIVTSGQRTVRQFAFTGNQTVAEYLPAEPLQILLKMDGWRFLREVDLTESEDREVTFELEPIVFSGSVYLGKAPAAGTVKFYVGQESVTTETTDGGQFQITLWEPRMYVVEVALENDRAPPYREYFVEILQSGTRDFHIPDNHYAAHITNAHSGQPVVGAEVFVTNIFRVGEGPEQTTSQGSIAGEDGLAALPPLRAGSVTLVARAKGYIESAPIVFAVDGEHEPASVDIRLRTEAEGVQLQLRLWDGRPAAGADLIAVSNDLSDVILWKSSTEVDGSVRVPSALGGAVLLIRHSHAAALARVWNPSSLDVLPIWQLSPPSAPLSVKVTDTAGEPVRFAHLVLWVEGIPLRGAALRFVSGATPATDRDGYWRATGLGGQTYQILATRELRLPLPEWLAQVLEFPWPAEVSVRVVASP